MKVSLKKYPRRSNYNEELNQPFTIDEINRAFKSLNNNKAPSPLVNILNEYLKHLPPFMLQITCKLFNIIFDSGIFPEIWGKELFYPCTKIKAISIILITIEVLLF